MTFEEYWLRVKNEGILPNEAITYLPSSFSYSLKRKLMRREPQEVARKIQESIDEINKSSIDTVETLLKKL